MRGGKSAGAPTTEFFATLLERETMKPDIHPEYKETVFNCACGQSHKSYSTLGGSHRVDICAACHPFFTGKEKLVDTAGRIDKFNRRYKRTETGS